MRCWAALGVWLMGAMVFAATAFADPVLKPGPAAGAATAWRVETAKVVLTIGERYDPGEIAESINASVPKAKAAVVDKQVVVTGVEASVLLSALAKIEAEPVLDDVDAMLQALQTGGDEEEGTGSSIRARRGMAVDRILGPQAQRLQATVLAVQRGQFPLVVITVRVDRAPKGASVAAGDTTTIVPRIRNRIGKISPSDEQSLLNVGRVVCAARRQDRGSTRPSR